MNIQHLFPVPLLNFQHPEAATLCPDLRRFFLDREGAADRDDIERDTQLGAVFESRFDLFYRKDPELQPLIQFVHGALAATVAQLNGYGQQLMDRLRFDYHALVSHYAGGRISKHPQPPERQLVRDFLR